MKLLKILTIALGLASVSSFAQEVVAEELPLATISSDYIITLDPDLPVQNYYKADISHLTFSDETEAKKLLAAYCTGNLISNEVFYSEGYMIIRIHTEYMGGDLDYDKLHEYLHNYLTKPE
jgi:hypothetical protein